MLQTNRLLLIAASFAVSALVAGCAGISSNTVQLSVDVTARMKDVETAHLRSINMYFDSEVDRAERFMSETWIPLFLRNFLGTSGVLADLQRRQTISDSTVALLAEAAGLYLLDPSEGTMLANAVRTALEATRGNDLASIRRVVDEFVPDTRAEAATTHLAALLAVETPAQMILEFAEAANEEIDERRRTLIEPIEGARAQILAELRVAYQDIYAGQGVLTGRLEAAAKRSQETARLVDALGGEGTAAAANDKFLNVVNGFNAAFAAVEAAVTDVGAAANSSEGSDSEKASDLFSSLLKGLDDVRAGMNREEATEESLPNGNDGDDDAQ